MGRSPDALARARRAYLARHPDRRKATVAKYYATHKDQERLRLLAWQRKHATRYAAWRRQYKRARYAAGLDTPTRWLRAHPEKVRVYKANTKARRKAVAGILTVGLVERLLILQRGGCAICQKRLTKYHLDHIMPMALGGLNEDGNMQVLCPRCNQTKSARHPVEFMQSRGQLL